MVKVPITLDAVDRRILRALQRDGRLPIVALAEQVGLSPTPCQRRVRRLEEEGVIARYAAVLDPVRLGLPLQAFVLVALESHAEEVVERFHRALAERPEVLAAAAPEAAAVVPRQAPGPRGRGAAAPGPAAPRAPGSWHAVPPHAVPEPVPRQRAAEQLADQHADERAVLEVPAVPAVAAAAHLLPQRLHLRQPPLRRLGRGAGGG